MCLKAGRHTKPTIFLFLQPLHPFLPAVLAIFYYFFPPFDEVENLNTESLVNYIEFVLSVFHRSIHQVGAITGDDCTTNVKIAKVVNRIQTKCFHVGCSSHCFNLCINEILFPYKGLKTKVNKLMHKLKNLIRTAKIRCFNSIKPIISSVTRLNSV